MSAISNFSPLTGDDERYYIADVYVIGPFVIATAIGILFTLLNDINSRKPLKYDKKLIYAYYSGILSVFCSILTFSFKLFCGNDLIIPWDIDSQNFVSMMDSVIFFWSVIGKITFYYAFTFRIQTLLKKQEMNIFAKILIFVDIFIAIFMFILAVLFIIDDASNKESKEIGITEIRKFHIAMYLGHENETKLEEDIMSRLVFSNAIYLFMLILIYISILKQISGNQYLQTQSEGIKDFILLILASIIFGTVLIFIGLDLSIKYLFVNIFIITDDICLFLMFKGNLCKQYWDNICSPSSTYQQIETPQI